MSTIQKPTTAEKQKAISIFKIHYQGFKSYDWSYGVGRIKIDDNIKVGSGIEKTCIIPDNFPWVIKCDTYNNEEVSPCMTEAKNFQRAISCGVSEYFAPTYYIGEYDGVKLVLQKKMIVSPSYTESHAYEVTGNDLFKPWKYTLSDGSSIHYYPTWDTDRGGQEDILIALYDDYDLVDFCRKYRINDLHNGNFGWEGDTPYITDFSGYHENEDEDYDEEDDDYDA